MFAESTAQQALRQCALCFCLYPFGMTMPGRRYEQVIGYRYGFNGKEKDKDVASDDYDFGARIYDSRIGRWLSVDKFASVYCSISPYVFGANSPSNLTDGDGNLLKDKHGNIIATSTGTYIERNISVNVGDKSYRVHVKYEVVKVYTDKGTPVVALKKVESYAALSDDNGALTRVTDAPIGVESNCHGYAFAGGQVIIEDNTINSAVLKTIITDDGYTVEGFNGNVTQAEATGFILTDRKFEENYHSGLKNDDGTWSADHGEKKTTENVSLDDAKGSAGSNSFVKTRFMKGEKNKGRANGIKFVSERKLNRIMKRKGIENSKQPVDGTNYKRGQETF